MVNFLSDYLVSKIFIDQPQISYEKYQKVKPIFDELQRWGETVDGFQVDNPGSWVKTGHNLVNKMVEAPTKPESPVQTFLDSKNEGEWAMLGISMEFLTQHVYQKNLYEIEKDFDDKKLCRVEIDYEAYLEIDKEDEKNNPHEYLPQLIIPNEDKEEICRELGNLFWDERSCVFIGEQSEERIITNHQFENKKYYGDTGDLVDIWQNYIDEGVRRVIILQGMPGTGKSTLCAYASEKISDRTIVMGHDFIKRVGQQEWKKLQNALNPEMIIVDDIDRLNTVVLERSLSMFEESFYDTPLTLFTTNDESKLPMAFKRPGRVDQIIDMPEPPMDVKQDMIRSFAKDVGIEELPDEKLEYLTELYNEIPSGAYVKEVLKRYHVEGFDYEIPDFDLTFEELTIDTPTRSY